jgi:UDP-N-acetyl-2-amino-2-deoxyglucuronate dehydrogenase
MTKNFAIIGVGGYIAPRHMKAIKELGHNLLAAVDKNDSVGVIDNYFPDASFFVEFERFERHVEKLRTQDKIIDYFVICSPNYLHDTHIRFALRYGADVICEKPLVLNPWNIELLKKIENDTHRKINTILQLRVHPEVIKLKERIDSIALEDKFNIELTYITSRGNWYYTSWKGDESKSGGIATNIGIHFFDMLIWIFGKVISSDVNIYSHDRAAGYLQLAKANVTWFLSINESTLPQEVKSQGKRTYRSIKVNDDNIEFSDGFSDLHTKSYEDIIDNKGFGLRESEPSIALVHQIRNTAPIGLSGIYHPYCILEQSIHPFNI